MAFQKLQLKQLSKTGELLRCINCFAGQVTVFRGYSPVELMPYQRFFAGVSGPDRIVGTLDGRSYDPSLAYLVGFGESFPPGLTVADFFSERGFTLAAATAQLRSFGMEVALEWPCNSLSADFQRRLRLIAALAERDRIIVLNNPFEDIGSGWRERFAEAISGHARTGNQLVIVPSLNYRPEDWINNDVVARIQVGQNTQRTIGFGSDPSQMNVMVEQLRAALQDEGEVARILQATQSAEATARSRPATTPRQSSEYPANLPAQSSNAAPRLPWASIERIVPFLQARIRGRGTVTRRRVALVGSFAIVMCALFLFPGQDSISRFVFSGEPAVESNPVPSSPDTKASPQKETSQKPPAVQSAGLTVANDSSANATTKKASDPKGEPRGGEHGEESSGKDEARAPIVEQAQRPPRRKPESLVLDLYPASVKQAISETMRSPSPRTPASRRTTPQPERSSAGDSLFSLLEQTSGTGSDLPPTQTSSVSSAPSSAINRPLSSLSREEIEERRRKIREKFLEAIEKRAQAASGN